MMFEWWLSGSFQLPLLPAQIIWTVLLAVFFAYAAAQSLPFGRAVHAREIVGTLAAVLAAAPLGAAVSLRITLFGSAAIPGIPVTSFVPSAGLLLVAWLILVGAYRGPLPAMLAGLAAGMVRAFWGTHLVATALEYSLMGWLLSMLLRQNYSGVVFAILRRPWAAAVAAGVFVLALRFGSDAGSASGGAVTVFDYAVSRLPVQTASLALECGVGAIIAEALRLFLGRRWPAPVRMRPTAYHQSIAWKLGLWLALPLAAMAATLTLTVVLEARDQARSALEQKMRDAAAAVRNDLPVALTIGHSLAEEIASEAPAASAGTDAWRTYLAARLGRPPFFSQLGFLSSRAAPAIMYPTDADSICRNEEEAKGCTLAWQGLAWDGWMESGTPPVAWISFAQPVKDSSGRVVGVLVGRTSLENNPMLMAIPKEFAGLNGGQGIILDANNRVVYPLGAESWKAEAPTGVDADGGEWFLENNSGGGKDIAYLLPLGYPDVTVGIRLPESLDWQIALANGMPVGIMALIAAALTEVLALLIARQIILPLRRLAVSAGQIAAGDWERTIEVSEEDEIGMLGGALEAMRRNLRRQMQQQELLLRAGQTMATCPDFAQVIDVLLRSTKAATGAGGFRLALIPALQNRVQDELLALGEMGRILESINDAALDRTSDTGVWTGNRSVDKSEEIFQGMPESIRALILLRVARGSTAYGALCIAFRETQAFEMGMLDLLAGLANQAAMAMANLSLLENTEGERQRLAVILDAVPEGVAVADADGRLLYSNSAFGRMLGIKKPMFDRPLGETVRDPELVDFLMHQSILPVSRDIAGAKGISLQGVVQSARSADGAAVWQVCVLQDVSRLRQRDDMKSEFVHTVSHDLRRPLTAIDGLANMLEMMGPLNPAQKDYARRIRRSAQNMQRLVTDLLDLGRLEQGAEIRRLPVSIKEMVIRVVEEWKTEAASAGVRVNLDLPEDLPDIPADASLLERALGNLLENAIRFHRAGGSADISVTRDQNNVVIAVRDDGIGIAPADQPHIFEKYFRGAAGEDPDHPAWGLGLAIVKQVAAWHHGKTWFESHLGQGSAFYLSLPIKH